MEKSECNKLSRFYIVYFSLHNKEECMSDLFEKFDRTLMFFIIYTIVFLVFFNTLGYTLPFVLALLFALLLRWPTRFLMKKFKIKGSLAAIITTIVFYAVFFTLVILLITALVSETVTLAKNIANYVSAQNIDIPNTFENLKKYYQNLNPTIVNTIEQNIPKINNQIVAIVSGIASGAINILTNMVSSIPYFIMLFIFTLIATYFFNKDISTSNNTERITSHFSDNAARLTKIFYEVRKMVFNYMKAYLMVIAITFLVTLVGFLFFGIKYALVLSLLCGLLDLLPVLGIPMVYFPLAAYYALNHKPIIAFGLLILYALVFIIRQIVEPRLVSATLDVHPVAVLAAFFIGLKAAGIMGMMYCLFLVVFYNIFRKVDVI